MDVVVPKHLFLFNETNLPLFFLAGPEKGGQDWQAGAAGQLMAEQGMGTVAIPYSKPLSVLHPCYSMLRLGKEDVFGRQAQWERHHLNCASRHGCIIFWLPAMDPHYQPTIDHPYARFTYGELGEWRAHLQHNRSLRVVVGGESGFPGFNTEMYNWQAAISDFQYYHTLEETVSAAISRASG